MFDAYLSVKLLHVLSATVLFGTGIGIAFFMFNAWMGAEAAYLGEVVRRVVLADWMFTTPAVIVQFASGLYLAGRLGIPYNSVWFVAVMSLFILIGCCWIPVLVIQYRVRDLLAAGAPIEKCRSLMRVWTILGCLAFGLIVLIFVLMVFKVGIDYRVTLTW